MRHFGHLLVVAGLVLGVGCKRAKRTPPVNKEVAEVVPYVPPKVESTPASLKLLDPGKNPRQVLRFQLAPGQKETGTLTLDMIVQMKDGPTDRPPQTFPIIKLAMKLEVKDVSPEGDARYDFEFVGSTVEDRGDKAMGALMDYQTKQIVGMGGTVTLSPSGRAKNVELRIPEQIDSQTRQLVETIKQSAANFSPPLPDEPVGVGATWVETAVVVIDGMKVVKTTNYKVASVEKGIIQLEVTSQHTGDPKAYAPSAPPGTRIELKEYKGSVTGRVTMQLDRVLAPSTQKAETVVDVFVSTPAEDLSVRTTTHQIMSVSDIQTEKPTAPAPAKDEPAAAPGEAKAQEQDLAKGKKAAKSPKPAAPAAPQ